MSIPFDQQRTQSGNSIFEDVYVYGCLHVSNRCGIILTAPNGDTYNIVATNSGVGIGGGGGTAIPGRLNLTSPNGSIYQIEATNDGIVFTTPDSNGDGSPDSGYLDITANSFTKVGGGSTQFLMADGTVSTRYISTETDAPNNGIGTDGDTYLIVNC